MIVNPLYSHTRMNPNPPSESSPLRGHLDVCLPMPRHRGARLLSASPEANSDLTSEVERGGEDCVGKMS
jgi:hypothetical protein